MAASLLASAPALARAQGLEVALAPVADPGLEVALALVAALGLAVALAPVAAPGLWEARLAAVVARS